MPAAAAGGLGRPPPAFDDRHPPRRAARSRRLDGQLAHSRALFAAKHHGPLRAWGICAALALGHLLRIALRAPLVPFDAEARRRLGCEARALAVLLGLAQPPLRAG